LEIFEASYAIRARNYTIHSNPFATGDINFKLPLASKNLKFFSFFGNLEYNLYFEELFARFLFRQPLSSLQTLKIGIKLVKN
jgi:hypothetical protein